MARKRRKKKAVRRSAKRPSLRDALGAVQAAKSSGKHSDDRWHMLSAAEGILRKLVS